MSAPVSVIIPTRNAVAVIGPTLGALVEGVTEGLLREVIIADCGSEDEIERVAEDSGATLIRSAPGRGAQLAAGAAAAKGDWLLFLHADTLLTGGWTEAMRRHMARHPESAACCRLAFDSERQAARWVAGWANWRTWLFALPYGDQSLLVPRTLYDDVGGYPQQPLMEDIAIARSIGRKRLRRLDATALTAPDRYECEGYFRRGLKNWHCAGLYFAGVSPDKILEIYRRS